MGVGLSTKVEKEGKFKEGEAESVMLVDSVILRRPQFRHERY